MRSPLHLALAVAGAVALLVGCDDTLSTRYGMQIDFPPVAAAPSSGQACAASLQGTGSVDATGRILVCTRVAGKRRWSVVPTRRGDRPTVLVYGDSLAEEIRPHLLDDLADLTVVFRVFGGTAPCDWAATASRDIRAYQPDLVVTSFIGNNVTTCTHQATGEELAEGYAAALTTIAGAAQANGASTIFVVAPPPATPPTGPEVADRAGVVAAATARLGAALAAQGVDARSSDDGLALVDPLAGARTGTLQLACLPGETGTSACVDGFVSVRNPDGVHLCPTNAPRPGVGLCSVRAPGAERYAAAVAQTVRAALAGGPLPRPAA